MSNHLGGANELFWWELMKSFHWSASPIPVSKEGLPDFHITSPYEFFCEVTTLNRSEYEKRQLSGREGLSLEHSHDMARMLTKVTEEKTEQIRHGHAQKKPSVLVVFDCTFWGGFGTQRFQKLANFLLGNTSEPAILPSELSAIVYMDSKFCDGRFIISGQRSTVYHNPNSQYKLPTTVFQMMRQYLSYKKELQPTALTSESDYYCWI